MLYRFEEGPREQWQAEMESLSREALLVLLRSMVRILDFYGLREAITLADVRQAKKTGRIIAAGKRADAFLADPAGATRKAIRRSAAAKKAARRRKRESKWQ